LFLPQIKQKVRFHKGKKIKVIKLKKNLLSDPIKREDWGVGRKGKTGCKNNCRAEKGRANPYAQTTRIDWGSKSKEERLGSHWDDGGN